MQAKWLMPAYLSKALLRETGTCLVADSRCFSQLIVGPLIVPSYFTAGMTGGGSGGITGGGPSAAGSGKVTVVAE